MGKERERRIGQRVEAGADSAAWIVIFVASVVLIGWCFGWAALTSLHPGLASMKVNTALTFLCLGSALRLSLPRGSSAGSRWPSRAVSALAGVGTLIPAATLLEWLVPVDLGIDVLLFADPASAAQGLPPGRMSPLTALTLSLSGIALLARDKPLTRMGLHPAHALASLSASCAFVAVAGYLYDVRSLYSVEPFSSVALHTAITCLVLNAGVLAARPSAGLTKLIIGPGPAGMLARHALPLAIVIPVGLGWMALRAQRAGWYSFEFGLALFAVANVLCFSAVIVWSVLAVRRLDRRRRRAEALLREKEHDLAITLDSIGDGVIATDASGRVTRMNPVAEQLTGHRIADALGKPLADVFRVIDEETGRTVESPAQLVLREGVVAGLANRAVLISRSGEAHPIADSGAPIRDEEGRLRGVVLVFRDQTEERRAQRALQMSAARKTAIFTAALDCIVTVDHTGAIQEFNPAAEKTFGYSHAEALGKPLADLLIPSGLRERHRVGFRRYMETGVGSILGKRIEIQALRADGREFPVELTVVATRLDGPPSFTAYIRDLTERKATAEALQASRRVSLRATKVAETQVAQRQRAEQALLETEEQLRQSQKMEAVGTLAGGIAHDFNNLLSVIISYAEMTMAELNTSDPIRDDLEQIVRAGKRASDLTRQLLAFSRRQVLQPKPVNLSETVSRMTGMLNRLIGEDIELVFKPPLELDTVFVDPGQIEQVLLNLVVNARDAMPRGGNLTIELANVALDRDYAAVHLGVEAGQYVVLSVSDTGIGMDASIQDRIFEPFFTTKDQGKGTGLGLSTVFGIVKQSGGSIWVYSELGSGTTFKVYLPKSQMRELAPERASLAVASLRGSETILVVEDDEQVRALTRTLLKKHGYQVLEAGGGGDALLMCEQHAGEIDLLLTDVVMPRMSGRELAERLERIRPAMKVVFVSGYTDDAVVRHGILRSEMAFVQKPIVPDVLLTKLREVLNGASAS